jgi:pimeloyl-ACP methyl ester carboxylesterase
MKISYEASTQWVWNTIVTDNLLKDLGQIRVPTLIIRGEHDALVPQSWMERIKTEIPNLQLVVIKEAGHDALVEQPDQFVKIVYRFLVS